MVLDYFSNNSKSCSLLLIAIVLALANIGVHAAANVTKPDIEILNYALALEHLEFAFYRDGINLLKQSRGSHGGNMRGKGKINAAVYSHLTDIRDHEETHVNALTAVIRSLGGVPVEECKYDFGYNGPSEFLQIARVLENVGVSAYTGAAYKIVNTALLTAAAAIATVEARHAAYLNDVNHVNPFPTAFDSPLDMRAVVGLAAPFIVSCPQNITIQPYTPLTAPAMGKRGKSITLTTVSSDQKDNKTMYCVFYSGMTSVNSTLQETSEDFRCRIPNAAVLGDNFLFLMSSQTYQSINSTGVIAGPALITVN
jgi:rubrerythrin